jgi:hypothetical protein
MYKVFLPSAFDCIEQGGGHAILYFSAILGGIVPFAESTSGII